MGASPAGFDPTGNAIVDALLASGQDNAHLYALIDMAALPEPADWLARIKAQGARNVFLGHPEASAEAMALWLLPVSAGNEAGRRLLHKLVEIAIDHQSVTWLNSALPAAELDRRLSRRLTARLDQGPALFRFYDPRLLPVIHALFDPHTRAAFFALGESWHYLDDDHALHALALTSAPESDDIAAPVVLSAEQCQRLQRVSERYQLARWLGKRRPEYWLAWPPGRRMAFVASCDRAALDTGLTSLSERLKHCVQALDRLHEDPKETVQ